MERNRLGQAHYSPVMKYPNPAEKFISYADKRATVMDDKGNSYFVAFPPFAFLLGFWALRLFHLQSTALCS